MIGSLESCSTGIIEMNNGKWSIHTFPVTTGVDEELDREFCLTGVLEIDTDKTISVDRFYYSLRWWAAYKPVLQVL